MSLSIAPIHVPQDFSGVHQNAGHRNTEALHFQSWSPYDIVSVEEAFSWLGPRHLNTVRANTCALCLLVIYITSCLLHTGPCKSAPRDRLLYCIDLCNALSNDLSIINPRH
jgi:hypothetical protein